MSAYKTELYGSHMDTQQLANACKAAGDGLRMEILRLLGQGAFGVLELCSVFDIKQSSMSHHLKILLQAELVSTQREGNRIFYRRPLVHTDTPWGQWLFALFQTLDQNTQENRPLEQAVKQVLDERAQHCAEFFDQHAHEFKEQQDLIASYDQYGQTLIDLLNTLTSNQTANRHALEIGPGEGAFIPELAQRFAHVTAVDISSDMLAKTRQVIAQQQLDNVNCVLGSTTDLNQREQYQFAAANMVLHHVPAPRAIFIDVSDLLAPGGSLLITDLCRHEQSWAHESCGDLWLGFAPEELSDWATDAGLNESTSQFLGLRNGFQIQFRLFHKPFHSNARQEQHFVRGHQ